MRMADDAQSMDPVPPVLETYLATMQTITRNVGRRLICDQRSSGGFAGRGKDT